MSLDAKKAIGARIGTVRRRMDRSPRDFARLLGVPHDSLRRWEAGFGFSQNDLLRLAEATDTPVDWLVEGLTDRDIAEGEEIAASVAVPLDPDRLFPRSNDRIRVQRVMADEELSKSIASALKLRPETLVASRDAGAARPSAQFLDPLQFPN